METCRHPNRGQLPPLPCHEQCRHSSQASSYPHSTQGTDESIPWWKRCTKKYIILCMTCGAFCILLGIIFIVIYFILRSYTSSLQFFETIPTYVPAAMLVVTGLMVMCFAKRRNRYAHLIKLAGGCCLICALLCVVITVTTTVVHMNRLQTLHECVYTPKTKTCMCISAIVDSSVQDGMQRFVFDNTPNCEIVHGSLSVCLRILFGLSVVGILICIFSSMLVYQLLTHEKKKVYLEQLELRRRFLYRQRNQQGFCNYCDDPWQLWEMLNDGRAHLHEEDPGGTGRWPWSRRLCSGVASRIVQYCRPGTHSTSPSSRESPTVFPSSANDYFHIFGSRNGPSSRRWHRRTRSNDGVFHHLHFTVPPYAQASFLTGQVPNYMWGPPPPYSQPPSDENVSVQREVPYGRGESEVVTVDAECISTHSSKKSSPPSNRHYLYHGFPAEGIALTIGSRERRKSEDGSCVVQVHVPACVVDKREVIFNTLPTRSSRKREPNPFKSLSNIPLCLSRKLSGFKNMDGTLSLIETCYEVSDETYNCSLDSLAHQLQVRSPSEESTLPTPSTQSSLDFPATILELPSDFQSSMVVATSPSTPVTDKAGEMVYAQSMPNLSVSIPVTARLLHRLPSSEGDTSTSQDIADFELEYDESSLAGIADYDPQLLDEEHVGIKDEKNSVVVVVGNANI